MRDSRARAAIRPACPGTRSVTVSKKASVTTSKPSRVSPSAMIRVMRCTRSAMVRRPFGPWYTA